MTTPKPTFLFVPGAWHRTSCFDLLRAALSARGWETDAVATPSVGAEPPTKGLADDVEAVHIALATLADERGKEVVLVVHSYGGLVGAGAVEGFGVKERAQQGNKGGVVLLVYLAAFVVPDGKCIVDMLGEDIAPWFRREGEYVYADTPEIVFYHDVESELQKKAITELSHTHQPARTMTDKATFEPWQHGINCMYLFCNEDKAIPLAVQEAMAATLGPDAITHHLNASHSPFLSQVEELVDGLEYGIKQMQMRLKAS